MFALQNSWFCAVSSTLKLDESKHRYKGRIVYRGDKVFTQNGDIVLFTEVSTSPTTLIALNVCLWWGALEGMLHQLETQCKHSCRAIFLKMSSRSLFCHDNCGLASEIQIQWQSCREASKVLIRTSAGWPLMARVFGDPDLQNWSSTNPGVP
jgi:hypothetical protein